MDNETRDSRDSEEIMTEHKSYCTIKEPSDDETHPENGICTCGYGRQVVVRSGRSNYSHMYSGEVQRRLDNAMDVIIDVEVDETEGPEGPNLSDLIDEDMEDKDE